MQNQKKNVRPYGVVYSIKVFGLLYSKVGAGAPGAT
jgi:hypothetical protein